MSQEFVESERRQGKDRRRGVDRRKESTGIRNLFPFSLFLERRSGEERRSHGDRRRVAGRTG